MNKGVVGDSTWEKFVAIFGFKGLNEPLYIIAIVAWGAFSFRPEMVKYLK